MIFLYRDRIKDGPYKAHLKVLTYYVSKYCKKNADNMRFVINVIYLIGSQIFTANGNTISTNGSGKNSLASLFFHKRDTPRLHCCIDMVEGFP